ncbi:MAG: 3-oxoacyl-[acyl-carrier-protein] reductase [Erysipelothrix sp.]|jgi:3-oxoacyl-[acyl-carrier protein] reductase|nr:3-oxoacyl-[acyl-carrier-protein] reductase [Erysipelothrix sp.]
MNRPVVLITGASKGIGAATALTFAQAGYDVVINYSSSEASANQVASLCQEAGAQTLVIKANVADAQDCMRMIDETLNTFSRIDVLVNNAGIVKDNLLLRMSESDFDDVLSINLKGTFNCSKLVAKVMMKQRSGAIVNVSSIIGIVGNAGQANYAASKAGMIGFTKSLALELGSRGIRVNAVAPGFIETDMTHELTQEIKDAMTSRIPLKSLGKAKDVADGILFLAQAPYISAHTLVIDGGLTHVG